MERIEEYVFNITSDDFVSDDLIFDRWEDVLDLEIGDGPPNDGNFFREPKDVIMI